MKIHFCDLCNESVPQAALDSGGARLIKGRVICAACDAAMSHGAEHLREPSLNTQPAVHAGPPTLEAFEPVERDAGFATVPIEPRGAPIEPRGAVPSSAVAVAGPFASAPPTPVAAPRERSNAGLAWIAGLAIAFTALSIFVTDDRLARMSKSQSALEDELAKKDDALHGLATEFAKIHPALAGVETRITERVDAQRTRSAAADETLVAMRDDLGRFTARLDAIGLEVEKLRARVDQPKVDGELEKRFDELSARIAKAEDDRRALAEQVTASADSSKSATATPGAATAGAPNVPAAPPAWLRSVADLGSTEETVRWDAVTTLGATNDPAVVPHLLPMLEDPTWLVRMAAARVLGEMHAREAVPQLITMLEDVDSAARETAWIALRVITGKDLKFDSFAPEAERTKRAKAWSDWWKKEGGGDAAKAPAGS